MTSSGQRLNLDIGTKVKVEFEGGDMPVQALFVGMEINRYLILRLPGGAGLHEHLYEGKRLVVKYVSSGRIFGFQSRILAYMYKKGLIVAFLNYPEKVETYELRAQQRIECLIPAKLNIENQLMVGYVLDISSTGCLFGVPQNKKNGASAPALEEKGLLKMSFLGIEGEQKISCLVKSINNSSNQLALGLMFEDIADALKEQLDAYVQKALSFIEQLSK